MFEILGYLGRPRASACDRGEADVRGDSVQPGGELRARLVALGAFPGAQHRLLERVIGVVERAEHPVAVEVQRAPVWLDSGARTTARPSLAGRYSAGGLGGSAPSSVHAPGV